MVRWASYPLPTLRQGEAKANRGIREANSQKGEGIMSECPGCHQELSNWACPFHKEGYNLLVHLKAIIAARDNYHGGDLVRAVDEARAFVIAAEGEIDD